MGAQRRPGCSRTEAPWRGWHPQPSVHPQAGRPRPADPLMGLPSLRGSPVSQRALRGSCVSVLTSGPRRPLSSETCLWSPGSAATVLNSPARWVLRGQRDRGEEGGLGEPRCEWVVVLPSTKLLLRPPAPSAGRSDNPVILSISLCDLPTLLICRTGEFRRGWMQFDKQQSCDSEDKDLALWAPGNHHTASICGPILMETVSSQPGSDPDRRSCQADTQMAFSQ